MFVDDIKIIETTPCLADRELFKALTRASADLTELLPYLNAVVEKPNYQPGSNSLVFKNGAVGFTLQGTGINITRFANITELYEILDWVKELINAAHESREYIEPDYRARKIVPVLTIYRFLPKTNCKECGEPSCMAFAVKLNKFDADADDCPLLRKADYAALREKLLNEMNY